MTRKEFFEWLDTIIDRGSSDWEVIEEFDDGNIWIRFNNIEEDDEEPKND